LNVKFPDSRLAVCDKCKKNFKTRDMCRVRNVHTSAPWSTAYICITVDESCTDENGKYVDKPLTVRMVQWQPFCVRKPFDSKTPVCATCKRTNRTRSFCRERHRHRHLPWCTVYVLLSALDQTDPSTVVAGASQKVENDEDQENASSGDDSLKRKAAEDASTAGSDTIASDGDWESDDINDIPESRTFLAKVSSRGSSIHWLDVGEYDPQSDPGLTGQVEAQLHYGGAMPHADHLQYFHAPLGYTAQAHQNALKSNQQYFFQMHRQQQQHPPPPPPYAFVMPAAPWQYNLGQGETPQAGIGAGDLAMTGEVAGPKRGAPEDGYQALQQQQQPQHHHQQQQQWALYYGHQGYGQEAPTHPGALLQNEMHNPDHYPVDVAADADDIENKRQRVA
jgi:hypothetical protein